MTKRFRTRTNRSTYINKTILGLCFLNLKYEIKPHDLQPRLSGCMHFLSRILICFEGYKREIADIEDFPVYACKALLAAAHGVGTHQAKNRIMTPILQAKDKKLAYPLLLLSSILRGYMK